MENTETHTKEEITEIWNAMKGDLTLGSGPTENKAWRSIGARNSQQRKELAEHGFKVVKQ